MSHTLFFSLEDLHNRLHTIPSSLCGSLGFQGRRRRVVGALRSSMVASASWRRVAHFPVVSACFVLDLYVQVGGLD